LLYKEGTVIDCKKGRNKKKRETTFEGFPNPSLRRWAQKEKTALHLGGGSASVFFTFTRPAPVTGAEGRR